MLDRSQYIAILEKYLAGKISSKEHDLFFALSSKEEEVDGILSEMMDIELNKEAQTGADLPPHVSEDILRNILISDKNTTEILKLPQRKPFYRLVAAAVFTALIGTALFILQKNKVQDLSSAEVIMPKTNIETTNKSNFKQTVQLSDGSKVTLEPNSSINYPSKFSAEKREVYLKGGAFLR